MIYLDNNASTKLDAEVAVAMARAAELDGNPSSLHAPGRNARRAIEEAREEVAALVGARCDEIFFTSGGTEANALAIFGATPSRPGRVVATAAEHPSVREAVNLAARRAGGEMTVVSPEPSGALDPERFAAAIPEGATFVTAMAANNEYGGLYPIAEAAQAAHRRGAVFHTDAVQAAGRIPVDVRAWDADLASFSAHKLHGPKGVGALFVRRGVPLEPHTAGGGQEKGLRPGTENTIGIVGFGAAARLARGRLAGDGPQIAALRDGFERAVVSRVAGARIVGQAAPRVPNTTAILFAGVPGDALLIALDLAGVAVSVGSACSSGTLAPSPAILSLGIPPEEARSVVRFSLSRWTTQQELAGVLEILPDLVARARTAPRGSRPLAEVASR
jgi:cysteine desulfurase